MVVMTRCRRDQANWLVSSLKMVKWWSAQLIMASELTGIR